jgi:hypothetical protein
MKRPIFSGFSGSSPSPAHYGVPAGHHRYCVEHLELWKATNSVFVLHLSTERTLVNIVTDLNFWDRLLKATND